jgi:hypothetical protein
LYTYHKHIVHQSMILRNHYRGVSLVVKAVLSEQLCSFSFVAGSIPVLSILMIC